MSGDYTTLSIPLGDSGVLFAFFVSSLIVFVLCFCVHLLSHDPLSAFPGPKAAAWTPLYSAFIMWSGQEHLDLDQAHADYGPIVRWKPDTLLVKDSALLPKLYNLRQTKPIHYNQSPSPVKSIVEENDWQKHREKRKMMDPLFTPKSVQEDEEVIDSLIATWISTLQNRHGNSASTFDFSMWGNYLILDVVGKRFFGKDLNMIRQGQDTIGIVAATSGNRRLVHTLARLAWLKAHVLFRPPFSWMFRPQAGDGTPFGALLKLRDELYEERLHTTDRNPRKIGLDKILFDDEGQPRKVDELWLRDEVLFVLLGASDTTGHALRMLVYNVASDSARLSRLVREIDEAMSHAVAGNLSFSRVSKLPYLAACIRESARHDPPIVSYLPRRVNAGGVELHGKWIPEGIEVAASPYTISRDKGLHGEDVDVFRPERFLDDPELAAKSARHEFTFGYGPRNCIGKYLSTFVLAKAMVQLLHNFEIQVIERGSGQAYLNWSWSGMNIRLNNRAKPTTM